MNETYFTIYRLDGGEIVAVQTMSFAPEHAELYHSAALAPWGVDTHGILERTGEQPKPDGAIHYIGTLGGEPTVMDRPEMPARVDKSTVFADGIDELTLTGLPDPCEIIIDDPDPNVETGNVTVTGGGFVFVAENPGTYTIQINRFPFLPFNTEITAT